MRGRQLPFSGAQEERNALDQKAIPTDCRMLVAATSSRVDQQRSFVTEGRDDALAPCTTRIAIASAVRSDGARVQERSLDRQNRADYWPAVALIMLVASISGVTPPPL